MPQDNSRGDSQKGDKKSLEQAEARTLAQRAESSAYYRRIRALFSSEIVSDADRRRYVSAVAQCFDINYNAPKSILEIMRIHGLNQYSPDKYELLLNKKRAKKFLVDDCKIRGITARQIRAIKLDMYTERFDQRKPFTRGRSSYWFTLAEWCVLLDLDFMVGLPDELIQFGRQQGLKLS